MKTTNAKRAVVVLMVALFAAPLMRPTQLAYAADPHVERARGGAVIGAHGAMASGAAEDSLKACMARIPGGASAGQRMLAKQTCAGEGETRKVLRSAPKF